MAKGHDGWRHIKGASRMGGPGMPKILRPGSRPRDQDLVPLEVVTRMLVESRVPGYTNRASVRNRIIEDKTIKWKLHGKRYFVSLREARKLIAERSPDPAAVEAAVRGQPSPGGDSEDQLLIKHFLEDPKHDHITALAHNLTRTLTHAKHIYDEFRKSQTGQTKQAEAEAAAARATSTATVTPISTSAEPETPCSGCGRTAQASRHESEDLLRQATGGREFLSYGEFALVAKLAKIHRCPECLSWRKDTPVDEMRACLRTP